MPEEIKGPDLGIELPEDLTTVDAKALASLKDKLVKNFNKINDKEEVTAEELNQLTAIADAIDAVTGEGQRRQSEQAERAAAREGLASRVNGEGEGGGDVEVVTDVPTVAEVVEPGEGDDDDEDETEDEDVPVTPEAVAASGKPTKQKGKGAVALPRTVPSTAVAVRPSGSINDLSIVASSDIPGVPTGKELDRIGLAKAVTERARLMQDSKSQALVASISLPTPKWDLSKLQTDEEIRDIFNRATGVEAVEAMVASGGWCAPSETIYDFACDFETVDGLIDLPTLTTNRGGLRYPISPLLGDVFNGFPGNGSGFTWTEADDIAAALPGGPTKPCFRIPCPTFEEERLQAQGICVTAGNLTDRAYPELTARYLDLVMAAHAHRMNGLTIARMVANSTALPAATVPVSAAEAVLATLELRIAQTRDVFFMADDFPLEVILPRWLKHPVRRDLARRSGVAFDQVSDGEITAFFTEIGARVQWVSDYQRLANNTDPTYPANVQAIMYPAGSHALLTGGSIDLGVVRDSTLNETNDFTAAWSEEFWGLVTRCASYVIDIPICANGFSAEPVAVVCPTA